MDLPISLDKLDDFLQYIFGKMIVRAIKSADEYRQHCNRNSITDIDMICSLRVECRLLVQTLDISKEIENYKKKKEYLKRCNERIEDNTQSMNKESEDNDINENKEEDSEYFDSDLSDYMEEDDSDSDEEEIEEDKFTFSKCECVNCRKINSIYASWDNWNPSKEIEKILKKAVDNSAYSEMVDLPNYR